MYLDRGIPCKPGYLFAVPHKDTPMKAKEIEAEFPAFAKLFDGASEENTLLFYYKLNKREKVFEFKTPEDEDEVAELLGVAVCEETAESEPETAPESRPLTKEELNEFKEHMNDIREVRARVDEMA